MKKIIIVGFFAAAMMGLFPPWLTTYKNKNTYSERPLGYSMIFRAPAAPLVKYGGEMVESRFTGVKIDVGRLLIQWLIVAALTTGAAVVARKT